MSDETNASSGEGEAAPVVVPGNAGLEGDYSPEQAYADYQKKFEPAEGAETATAEPELAEEANAAPETATSEDATEDAPAETQPRELPRSWTKDRTEIWNKLDPSLQDFLLEKDSEASKEVRRTQNEAAEERKALKAEREATEKARKEYEAKLPALMESLQRQGEFADIKSLDDVKRLQRDDPFRFQAWQVYQMDAQAVEGERRQAEERQAQQKFSERNAFTKEQNAKLHDLIPELKDSKVAAEMRESAVKMLVDDYGFTEGELGAAMQTDDGFRLLTDARMQKLIADGLKLKALRSAPPKAIPKAVPAVQRPGVARAPGAASSDTIQALNAKLTSTGSVDDAYALYMARQKARA